MGTDPTFNIDEIKTLFESGREGSKLGTEFFKKDMDFLSGLEGVRTPKLVVKITEFLVGEGRPGSAEYVDLFSRSVVLDKELKLLESGNFDAKKIEQLGLPIMVDAQKTTPEMLKDGQAVLTQEARTGFFGSTSTLKYKLEQHIGKTAQKASEYYSNELADTGITNSLKNILGIKSEPYEIPFTPNEVEFKRLEYLAGLKVTSREEARQVLKRELEHMMRQRPGSIGLTTIGSAPRFFGETVQGLGGNIEGPVDIKHLRDLHEFMGTGPEIEELQIYPGFTKAVEESIENDLQ